MKLGNISVLRMKLSLFATPCHASSQLIRVALIGINSRAQ